MSHPVRISRRACARGQFAAFLAMLTGAICAMAAWGPPRLMGAIVFLALVATFSLEYVSEP